MRSLIGTVLASVLAASTARGEASHHQVGSGAGPVSTLGLDAPLQHDGAWHVRLFPSVLFASDKFDDTGSRTPLLGLSSIQNYSVNVFVERYLGERWSVSALTAWQHVRMDTEGVGNEFHSLADSYLNVRYSLPAASGTLFAIGSVKVPGTYPESEATGTKQVDAEGKVAIAFTEVLPRVSAVLSAGYKLRLGVVKDELTAALLLPIDVGAGITLTPVAAGGYGFGLGDLAKDSLSAGASATWTPVRKLQVLASWSRTLWGRNVAAANLVSLGIGTAF